MVLRVRAAKAECPPMTAIDFSRICATSTKHISLIEKDSMIALTQIIPAAYFVIYRRSSASMPDVVTLYRSDQRGWQQKRIIDAQPLPEQQTAVASHDAI